MLQFSNLLTVKISLILSLIALSGYTQTYTDSLTCYNKEEMQKIAATLVKGHTYQINAEIDSITISLLQDNVVDLKLINKDLEQISILKENIITLKDSDIQNLQKALKKETKHHRLTKISLIAVSLLLTISLVSF
jgi:hypothetical protein